MATIVEDDTGRPPVTVPVDASLVTPVKSARVKNLPATDHPTGVATTGSSDRLVEYLYLVFIFSFALSYAITGAVLLAATSDTFFTIAGMALFWLIPVVIIRLPEAKPWDRWGILVLSAPFDLCAIFGIIMAEMDLIIKFIELVVMVPMIIAAFSWSVGAGRVHGPYFLEENFVVAAISRALRSDDDDEERQNLSRYNPPAA